MEHTSADLVTAQGNMKMSETDDQQEAMVQGVSKNVIREQARIVWVLEHLLHIMKNATLSNWHLKRAKNAM